MLCNGVYITSYLKIEKYECKYYPDAQMVIDYVYTNILFYRFDHLYDCRLVKHIGWGNQAWIWDAEMDQNNDQFSIDCLQSVVMSVVIIVKPDTLIYYNEKYKRNINLEMFLLVLNYIWLF